MKESKNITLKLQYYKSNIDRENGVYIGGVVEPKYLNELTIEIDDDYDYDFEKEEFIKNGLYSIELAGSLRALKELGKFLVNMAMFETNDEDYHEHLDYICGENGKPVANITIRKK